MDQTISDLTAFSNLSKTDLLVLEQSDGTKKADLESFFTKMFLPSIEESSADFPEISADDTAAVIAGKINKWQQDCLKKIAAVTVKGLNEFPDEPDETTLKGELISAYLAYTMNEAILKAVSDHGDLVADYEIMKREQMASYGYFGVEWDLDELMALVAAEKWDKFAIGDYVTETTTASETICMEITGKNSYLHCGDTEFTSPHIVLSPRDCLSTTYQYNTSNTNTGGLAASLMPSNLETEAAKFSSKLQGYMQTIRRLENNKSTWAWASRRIFLPGVPELLGYAGWSDYYNGGSFNQLPLFKGGNAHILKGRGYNKKDATRCDYWLADPSCANTTAFCRFTANGSSSNASATNSLGVAPLIVLAA